MIPNVDGRISRVVVIATALPLLAGSCNNSDDVATSRATSASTTAATETTSSSSSSSSTSTTSAPTTTTAPAPEYGVEKQSGGIYVTVVRARVAQLIEMNQSNQRPGSPFYRLTPMRPRAGAKYVVIETRVRNEGRRSVDLTCGFPHRDALIDDRGREFDGIGDLYKIAGNPECNRGAVQPGSAAQMTWVYEIPSDATTSSWLFADYTEGFNLGTEIAFSFALS